MPEYLSPGVYVEEPPSGIKPIEGVGTSTGAFIGIAQKGPIAGAQYEDGPGRPVLITNFTEFTRVFGSFIRNEFLAYAVQQFFGEGGTRCYVARTAHFSSVADRSTLTARRATWPLVGGVATTFVNLPATASGATADVTVASSTGIQSGMDLFLRNAAGAFARVRVTAVPNATTIRVKGVDAAGADVAIPAIADGGSVTQIILDATAINEGEWGNNLRVSVAIAGLVRTTVQSGLAVANAHQAVLDSVAGIEVGMALFITDGNVAARVQVTQVDEGARQITFINIAPAATPAIPNGARVRGTVLGKAATVLDGNVNVGAISATLLATDGINVGSILLLVSETFGPPITAVEDRVVVTRVVGKQVFFTPALAHEYPDRAPVTTEDFTLTVYDRDDVVETFPNLSTEHTNVIDYVQDRVNSGATQSKYIRARAVPIQAVPQPALNIPPARTPAPVRLRGGTDGDTEVEFDYIGNSATQTGFFAFDSVEDINILAAPGITFRSVILAGMTYCQNRKDCFFVGELPSGAQTVTEVLDFKNGTGSFAGQQALVSKYGALYWPWIRVLDPLTNRPLDVPPSGAVIGRYSATDVARGVHKAPAGIDDGFLHTVTGVVKVVTKGEQDLLNPRGIDVIRSLPGLGIVLWGARTTSSDPEWRYINVRRLFIFLEQSILRGTQWVVFEPNDPTLWKRITANISAFLHIQWLEGKLVGDKPEKAFFVKCDAETNPPDSVDLGRVITLIGVAPSKPAEFVIFRIMQSRAGSGASE